MRIDVTTNVEQVIGESSRLHPQFQFATARALTDTVRLVQAAMPAHLDSTLDRPTQFTKAGRIDRPAPAARPPVTTTAPPPGDDDPDEDPPAADEDTAIYRTERAKREGIRREREQLALQQERNELVAVQEVARLQFTAQRLTRDRIEMVAALLRAWGAKPAQRAAALPATQAGIGGSYWVRATLVSGDTPTGSGLNTWLPLSGVRTWTLTAPSGGAFSSRRCTLQIQIASDSAGANVVTSGATTLSVERES